MGILDVPGYSQAATDAKFQPRQRARRHLDVNNAFDLKSIDRVDALMANPPTVTLGVAAAATVLTNARQWSAASAANSPVIAPFRSFAGRVRSGGSGINVSNVAQVTPTGQNTLPFYIDFMTDAPLFEIAHLGNNFSFYRVRVDGQLVSAAPIATPSPAGRYRDLFDFGGVRKPRHIEIETSNVFQFDSVTVTTTDAIWTATLPLGPRVVWASDSYAVIGNDKFASIPLLVCRSLGSLDVYNSGVSGTGYLTPGTATGAVKLRDRLVTDVDANSPDVVVVVVAMGYNDTYFSMTPSAVQAEALLCYQQIKANNPNAVLIVIGHMTPMPPSAAMLAMDVAITATVAAAGALVDLYIRPMTNGVAPSWVDNAAQTTIYRLADGIHLTPAGTAMYAQRIADAIRAALPLGS